MLKRRRFFLILLPYPNSEEESRTATNFKKTKQKRNGNKIQNLTKSTT
jgi:hypothetical protein